MSLCGKMQSVWSWVLCHVRQPLGVLEAIPIAEGWSLFMLSCYLKTRLEHQAPAGNAVLHSHAHTTEKNPEPPWLDPSTHSLAWSSLMDVRGECWWWEVIPRKSQRVWRVKKTVSDQVGTVLSKMSGPQISGSQEVFHLSHEIHHPLGKLGDFRPPPGSRFWKNSLMAGYLLS